jgi:hypothetical protein
MLFESFPLTGHGTMPHYEITEMLEDILNDKDKAKDFGVKLINDKKNDR